MNKEKVTALAESLSRSCKELVKNPQGIRQLATTSSLLVAMTVAHLVNAPAVKDHWG